MADILKNYGSNTMPDSRTSNGGQMKPKDIPYSSPKGPSNINDPNGPGLHGTNHGNAPGQGKH